MGAIDEKYDVAISSSCAALDYIVVDTIDIAQQCVEFLKKTEIGAATFIALDKVSAGAVAKQITLLIYPKMHSDVCVHTNMCYVNIVH